jgi:hypothetical protein
VRVPAGSPAERAARSYGLRYTRYADDLAFSGSVRPERLIDRVRLIAADEGFRLNEAKTRIRGAADRQLLVIAVRRMLLGGRRCASRRSSRVIAVRQVGSQTSMITSRRS